MDDLSNKSKLVELEQQYVRDCYEIIADDFSNTRYKKWPQIEKFLQSLTQPNLLLDVGCGNGKYLDIVSQFSIGCDTSSNLLSICKSRGFEVVRCDMTRLPFRKETFDTIICIAALHHVITTKRRQICLEDIVNLLSLRYGKLLVQVWSYEQELNKDNPYLKRSQPDIANSVVECNSRKEVSIGDEIIIPIHRNRTPFTNQDMLVPFNIKRKDLDGEKKVGESLEQHLRYYHLFKEKELEAMFDTIPTVKVLESYNDKGNWLVSVVRTAGESNCAKRNR